MNFSVIETVRISEEECDEKELRQTLFAELRRISLESHAVDDDCITVESVNATFGSILRNDNTRVMFYPNRRKTGYTLEATVNYRPSAWFWIFFVIDILLIETVIGFIVGICLTLGMYFYQRKVVAESL